MNAAVDALLDKLRMYAEIEAVRMFEDQQTLLAQDPALEHQRDDLFALGQIVGCIGKDDVEVPFGAAFEVKEGVGLHGMKLLHAECAGGRADEVVVHGVDFDRDDAAGPPRTEFIADGPRARKEVQYIALFEIHAVA